MKKKLIAILTAVLLAATILAGCGTTMSKVKMRDEFKQTDYDYVVYSNGGTAVQYGEYLYFINGTRGYDDEDAKQNVWNKVIKGAIYRAKLLGKKSGRDFVIERKADTGLEFFSNKGNDYADIVSDEEYTEAELLERQKDIIDVDVVAPKVIGTSGYAAGGMFIYDDFVYYATPNNTKDRAGKTQVNRTDFMRTKLDGSVSQLIFTTEEDSADKPYGFFKQGEAVYLVCYYGTTLVSVRMPSKNNKIEKAIKITDEATSVIMSVRETYDSKNNITNDPEDFIYFTRAVTDDDRYITGNVVIGVRPDGTEDFKVLETGTAITLDAVKDGGLFYHYTNDKGNIVVEFDNLHNNLYSNSKTYKEYEDSKSATSEDPSQRKRTQMSTVNETAKVYTGKTDEFSGYTSKYFFRGSINDNSPNKLFTNEYYMIASSDSGTFLRSNGHENFKIVSANAEIHFINNNYMYYNVKGNTAVYRTELFKSVDNKGESKLVTKDAVITSAYKTDFAAGYIMYYAYIDEWATAYPNFRDLKVEGAEDLIIFKRSDTDVKPDEDE